MKYVYIKRISDEKIIEEYAAQFRQSSLEELVEDYNRQQKCGIVGVHRQALYLIAMRQEFLNRLKESPVFLKNYILEMAGPVEIFKGNIRIKEI